LEKVNATKDKFFSIIAHDLKNSFNGLLGYSDILLSDFDRFPDEEKKTIVSAIRQVSEGTYKLLQNLLDWARVQTGNIQFVLEDFDLKAFLSDELNLQTEIATEKGIKVKFDAKDDVTVRADKNMLLTVIRNIISNALKYSNKGGIISISLTHDDKFGVVTVKDKGVGISTDNIKKLFRVNGNYKTRGTNNEEGTGLGLILCKEFLIKNYGDITFESELGKGSIVTFTVPLSPNA